MDEITAQELKERLSRSTNLQLVDVREPAEFELCNLGGELVPLGELPKQAGRIRRDIPVVMICHHGFRSAQAINYLTQRLGYDNLVSLCDLAGNVVKDVKERPRPPNVRHLRAMPQLVVGFETALDGMPQQTGTA